MKIILLGPPGAGKGTLAEQITKLYDVVHISTGDLFRYNIKNETELGQLAKSYMNRGELVPDDVTGNMLKDKLLSLPEGSSVMLDGYPRNLNQAKFLDAMLRELKTEIDLVVNVELADELIVARLVGRRVCSQCGASFHVVNRIPKVEGICDNCGGSLMHRSDDQEEVISTRLKTYKKDTFPLIEYYQKVGKLFSVDNAGDPTETLKRVKEKLDGIKCHKSF